MDHVQTVFVHCHSMKKLPWWICNSYIWNNFNQKLMLHIMEIQIRYQQSPKTSLVTVHKGSSSLKIVKEIRRYFHIICMLSYARSEIREINSKGWMGKKKVVHRHLQGWSPGLIYVCKTIDPMPIYNALKYNTMNYSCKSNFLQHKRYLWTTWKLYVQSCSMLSSPQVFLYAQVHNPNAEVDISIVLGFSWFIK